MTVLRTQLIGVARRPVRLLLTGLAVFVASFAVYATVLTYQISERTVLSTLHGTPAAADLVVEGDSAVGMVEDIAAIPAVAEVAGRLDIAVSTGASFLSVEADPGSGPLSVVAVRQGRYPVAKHEIAVTARTADRLSLTIGAATLVRASRDNMPVLLTVTGIVEGPDDFGATAYAPFDTVAALADGDVVGQIDVRLAPGVRPTAMRDAVRAAVATTPASEVLVRPTVRPGTEVRADERRAAIAKVQQLFAVVAMFVAVAVVAGVVVTTSTFRIVFAQRMRQLALLRAVGASRAAIIRALLAEGTATGITAGTTGVLLALVIGHALPHLLRSTGLAVFSPGIPLGAAATVVLIAVAITDIAVCAPALSAARVSPLEALRASAITAGRSDVGVIRALVGLLAGLGAAAVAILVTIGLPDPSALGYDATPMLFGVVASGGLAFLALSALGPVAVRPILRTAGIALRWAGPVGSLAVNGVGRAPRRFAAVSVVVALGMTLMSGVIIGGASVRALGERDLAASAPADYELSSAEGRLVPQPVLVHARSRPELAHVTPYRRLTQVVMGPRPDSAVEVIDLDLSALPLLAKVDVSEGSLADVGPGEAVISGSAAADTGLTVGDSVPLSADGRAAVVTIAAVLAGPSPLLGARLVVHPADLDRLGAPAGYAGIFADAAVPGEQGRTAGAKALQAVVAGSAELGVVVLADRRDENNETLNLIMMIGIGLLGLTVIIAVVGVGTTTALSVVERAREAGLLRAVGMSRAGLRVLLTVEAALYGFVGAAFGLALGIPYAWLAVEALGINAPLEMPVAALAAIFVLMVALTAMAGTLPARRASRVSPVLALSVDA